MAEKVEEENSKENGTMNYSTDSEKEDTDKDEVNNS